MNNGSFFSAISNRVRNLVSPSPKHLFRLRYVYENLGLMSRRRRAGKGGRKTEVSLMPGRLPSSGVCHDPAAGALLAYPLKNVQGLISFTYSAHQHPGDHHQSDRAMKGVAPQSRSLVGVGNLLELQNDDETAFTYPQQIQGPTTNHY
jgi:hypothetical protein